MDITSLATVVGTSVGTCIATIITMVVTYLGKKKWDRRSAGGESSGRLLRNSDGVQPVCADRFKGLAKGSEEHSARIIDLGKEIKDDFRKVHARIDMVIEGQGGTNEHLRVLNSRVLKNEVRIDALKEKVKQ